MICNVFGMVSRIQICSESGSQLFQELRNARSPWGLVGALALWQRGEQKKMAAGWDDQGGKKKMIKEKILIINK